jgi:hypothetical protein
MSALVKRAARTRIDTGGIGDRGYDIVNAARLLQSLAVSEVAEGSHVPMPLQDLFQQVRYLGRQIETHAEDIITAADKGGSQ